MPVSLWITTQLTQPPSAQRLWLLQSGSMAVFAVRTNGDRAPGKRRYLFSLGPGEALFEIPVDQTCAYGMLGIALDQLEVIELDRHQLDSNPAGPNLTALAQHWHQQLASVFEETPGSLSHLDVSHGIGWDDFQAELKALHVDFFDQLERLEQQELGETLNQLEQREQLNHRAAEFALQGLRDVIQAQPADSQPGDTDLLAAAGMVGRHLGISIHAPTATEPQASLHSSIEAIARASRLRVRRLTLETGWWTQDQGALLSYTQSEARPVALLPLRSGQYQLFDPATHTVSPLGTAQAAALAPVAYTFYRPFPDRSIGTWDGVALALRGQARGLLDIAWVGVAATLTGMFTPFAVGILIDQAIPDANQRLLLQVGCGLLAASFGIAVFQLAQRRLLLRTQTGVDLTIQAAIWDRLLKLKLSFFRQYSTGDLKSRVGAISQIRGHLSGATLATLFTSLFALLNLLLLFFYSPDLAWIAVIVAVVTLLVTNSTRLIARQQFREMQDLEGRLFGTLVQMIGGISKLRVAGAENRAFAYWARQYQRQLKLMMNTQRLEDGLTVFNTLLPTLSSIIFFWFAVALINPIEAGSGHLSTGAFLAFSTAFAAFIAAATDLSNTFLNVLQVSILWQRVRPILEAPPEVDSSKVDPGRLVGQVKLDRVTFRYRPDGPLVLDHITLQARSGEFVAIVGPSGSGKSTIIRLLLGFEIPEQGSLYYDGQDLSELDLTAIRRQLGVVLQNGRITSASLLDNIAAGAIITLDEAWEAARLAGFSEAIQAMPMGMHTIISEGGSNLSGGQRQRLLIARALVLKPKILILDEATSALDNQTQAVISQNLEQMQVTRIAIAHRLSTIRHADRIYVLEQGKIVQQGSFEHLVAQPGVFQRMMARQMV